MSVAVRLPRALRQLEVDGWRQESHRRLMRLLALLGQWSASLLQYERCRAALAEELGIETNAETDRLYRQLRNARRRAIGPG